VVVEPEEQEEKCITLTERLERGPLPLSLAVHYACDIAKALRELHRQGKTHGAVSGRAVELQEDRAVLLPPPGGLLPESAWRSDIRGFGWVLQSLFPEVPPPEPPGSALFDTPSKDIPRSRTSFLGVWEAARRATAGCLAADASDPTWTIQKVATEFRLLDLVVRQWETKAQSQAALDPPATRLWRPTGSHLEQEASPVRLAPSTPAPPPSAEVQGGISVPAVQFRTQRPLPKISAIRCPRCGAPYVHPSTPRTDFEETLELWHMPVMRCHRCSFRYFQILGITIVKRAVD
jgi:hypothetical protein